MGLLKRERAVDIVAASGMVRVTISPKPAVVTRFIEGAVIVVFMVFVVRAWTQMSALVRALVLWAIGSATVAWFYQFSGSESIELDASKFVISKSFLGWNRIQDYVIADCHDLQWREPSEGDNRVLQCKVGWRTIRFGDGLSEDEAIEVLTALQANLPQVADQMFATSTQRKHFTTLDLS